MGDNKKLEDPQPSCPLQVTLPLCWAASASCQWPHLSPSQLLPHLPGYWHTASIIQFVKEWSTYFPHCFLHQKPLPPVLP